MNIVEAWRATPLHKTVIHIFAYLTFQLHSLSNPNGFQ